MGIKNLLKAAIQEDREKVKTFLLEKLMNDNYILKKRASTIRDLLETAIREDKEEIKTFLLEKLMEDDSILKQIVEDIKDEFSPIVFQQFKNYYPTKLEKYGMCKVLKAIKQESNNLTGMHEYSVEVYDFFKKTTFGLDLRYTQDDCCGPKDYFLTKFSLY